MSTEDMEAVGVARDYYNSEDADNFYSTIWGGEDIHVGLYFSEDDSILDASKRTQERMAKRLKSLNANSRVIDLGSGYGGAARFLARNYGCEVVALNLSEVENERARALNREQGLDDKIEVIDGNFEELAYDDETFDIAWSQDAFLHSPSREQVIKETARILKSGGEFVFTDPMQADDCPEGVLQPILERIHLESMASPQFYREVAEKHGFRKIEFEEQTEQLKNHYSAVLRTTHEHEDVLMDKVSDEYLANMKKGLNHWINGAENDYLAWGIFYLQKNKQCEPITD